MKIAFLYCPNCSHPCGGAAECMRMFREREGEFDIYPPEAYLASVSPCDYCANGAKNFEKTAEVLKKHDIGHIHLAACTSICKAGNYEHIKAFWRGKGMEIGEYTECRSKTE
ncbi:MAG: CGGC domain-containing protein [Clostridiaceae bacterium]|nr:CGGC domain-containing protein [Eubacteriales bacterium]